VDGETGRLVKWETGRLVDWETGHQTTNLPVYQSTDYALVGRRVLVYQIAPSIFGSPLRFMASTMGMVMIAVMADSAGTHHE